MTEYVPIIERPMAVVEAQDRGGFMAHLRSLLSHEAPAFIVRSDPVGAHVRHMMLLRDKVTTLFPDRPGQYSGWDLQNIDQRPIGTLHHDMSDGIAGGVRDTSTFPNIHTTESGGGAVRVAYVGTDPETAYKIDNLIVPPAVIDSANPHRALLRGEADPTLINPNVYVGQVAAGHSVIFSGDSGRYAAWHRFDTDPDLGQRSAQVGTIKPETFTTPVQGYDLQ